MAVPRVLNSSRKFPARPFSAPGRIWQSPAVTDPPLALARRRSRGELTELLASDLRFTPDEAAVFLNQVMGLGLSADNMPLPSNPGRKVGLFQVHK